MVLSADVTRRILTLGSRESTTGWCDISFSEETIEMIITQRGARGFYTPAGYFGQIDALGQCADPVDDFDQILTDDGRRYEVQYIEEIWLLDSFVRRDSALTKIPLWEASPGAITWSKTRLSPAQRQTKTWIDSYIRDAQITKDDDSAQASWVCMWKNDHYPLGKEFRTKNMHGLYIIDEPNSTALMGGSSAAVGYEEHVPIHVCAIDSTDVTGRILQAKMYEELRYISEAHPEGSRRSLERRRDESRSLGGMSLYDTVFELGYRRSTS